MRSLLRWCLQCQNLTRNDLQLIRIAKRTSRLRQIDNRIQILIAKRGIGGTLHTPTLKSHIRGLAAPLDLHEALQALNVADQGCGLGGRVVEG